MKRTLNSVLLVDDDEDTNFFHERLLKKMECAKKIAVAGDGAEAMAFLRECVTEGFSLPDVIFLDVNMPRMNGWEFLTEYEKFAERNDVKSILIMLSTSLNPDDERKALAHKRVKGFLTKFLDRERVTRMLDNFF